LWGFHREKDFVFTRTWQYNFCIHLFLQMNPPIDLMVPFSFYVFLLISSSAAGRHGSLYHSLDVILCFCT
jgi:hypothetical protein